MPLGNGGDASSGGIAYPLGISLDFSGNLLVCQDLLIRKINLTTHIITTVAGSDTATNIPGKGNGGMATCALLAEPYGVCTDKQGNIYIADYWTSAIRKVDVSTQIISIYAGSPTTVPFIEGAPATSVSLSTSNVCIDTLHKYMYISAEWMYSIKRVDMSTGIISTYAGTGANGFFGDNGAATNAQLSRVMGICTDKVGNLYIGDWDNGRIRKVDYSTGIITTIAGNGSLGYSGDGVLATNTRLNKTSGICIDSCGNLFFSDEYNDRVRRIDAATKIISTVAGNGIAGFSGDGGLAVNAKLDHPTGVCIDHRGNLYIGDWRNHRIRKVANVSSCYGNVGVNELESGNCTIYPNPTYDLLHIDGINTTTTYRLLSIVGASLQQGTLQPGSNEVNIATLPPGIYLLELTDENKRTITKILKQ